MPALWPACLLAVREERSGLFHLADLGPALANDAPALTRGLVVDAVPENTLVGRALGCLAGAFSTREAISLEGRFRHKNSTEMLYRAIGLPFLDVRGRLTYVVCAIGGKAVNYQRITGRPYGPFASAAAHGGAGFRRRARRSGRPRARAGGRFCPGRPGSP